MIKFKKEFPEMKKSYHQNMYDSEAACSSRCSCHFFIKCPESRSFQARKEIFQYFLKASIRNPLFHPDQMNVNCTRLGPHFPLINVICVEHSSEEGKKGRSDANTHSTFSLFRLFIFCYPFRSFSNCRRDGKRHRN